MTSRKYTRKLLTEAVQQCESWAALCRYFGLQPAGGNVSNLKKKTKEFGISTSHFTGQAHARGKTIQSKKHYSEYLVLLPEGANKMATSRLRKAMIDSGLVYQCFFSECPTRNGWINGDINFEIDHINGNNIDNRRENLRFLCANCHSQQPTSSHSWKNASRYGVGKSLCSCGNEKSKSIYKKCGKCARENR